MPPKPSSSRANWAALIMVILVTVALIWAIEAIVAHNKLQNCLDSGRRDCLPQTGNG